MSLWGSVGRRVMLAMLVVVLGIAVFQVLYFPAQQIEELSRALDKKALGTTRLIAYVAAPSVEFDDRQAAVEVMRGAAQDADFLGAVLYSEDGQKTLAAYAADKVPAGAVTFASEPRLNDAGSARRVVVPVVSQGGQKAVLVTAFSLQPIEELATKVRLTTAAISAAMMAVGLLLAAAIGRSLNRRMQRLVSASERVARGDLAKVDLPEKEGSDDVGRMTTAFRLMLDSQRQLVTQIASTATQLSSAATQLAASATQQERGATEQSTAVTETRRTMESLLESAREIAKTAQSVLHNAEHGQANSTVVAERITALLRHTQRITEILDVIRGIATKSDILALNAALEGTKAGEAGKGFSLVADQIQRLAENVMGAVKDIKELTSDISSATQSTVLATEESTKLAADTTKSARQITMITQQQESGTEQVAGAMELVSGIARQAADGSKDAVSSAAELRRLTEQLQALVGRFNLDVGA